MASTSSMASSSLDKPSTSASNEIKEADENTKQMPNPVLDKDNGTENGEKQVSKSICQDFSKLFKSKSKKSKPQEPTKENSPNPAKETTKGEEIQLISNSIEADLKSIENAKNRIKENEEAFKEADKKFNELKKANVNAKDLRELKKLIKALKQKILTQDKVDPEEEKEPLIKQLERISVANTVEAKQLGMMPNLFTDDSDDTLLQFQDFKALYNELPLELKLCLLCFSVFPEDFEIKRRVMVFWWIGEGFVPPRKYRPEESTNQPHWDKFDLTKNNPTEDDITPEHWANFYFKKLLEMGFIESAQEKPNPKVNTCKMHPFIRTMLNRIAQKAEFFEFDSDGILNGEFSKSLRACLLNGKKLTEDTKLSKKVHAIFNVDETIIDFRHYSLSDMKNTEVLYLGRWQNLGTHHIVINTTKIFNAKSGTILDGLQNIRNLRFLSFQGMSRITELPLSILKLKNLTILDIRACHNLVKIPDDIRCLVNLTHLDMSDCYLLDEMPKGISKLKKLQVLSGFVVVKYENNDSCTLDDLKGFSHLRKLSIRTDSDEFPSDKDLKALNQFKALSKLTITWSSKLTKSTTIKKEVTDGEQGHDSVNEQNPLIETEEKSTEEADKGSQENDQRPKQDNKEGEMKGNAVMQSQGKIEMSQESQKHDKGLQGATREIVKDNERRVQRTLTRRFGSRQSRVILPELPSHLTKLDLQCLPEKQLTWLRPEKLLGLKKLYIRGGKLSDLGQIQDFELGRFDKPKWEQVEELRLKYLDELDMEWRELLELFPKLNYLEKVHCPKLSFFPCDELGVWTKKKTIV